MYFTLGPEPLTLIYSILQATTLPLEPQWYYFNMASEDAPVTHCISTDRPHVQTLWPLGKGPLRITLHSAPTGVSSQSPVTYCVSSFDSPFLFSAENREETDLAD